MRAKIKPQEVNGKRNPKIGGNKRNSTMSQNEWNQRKEKDGLMKINIFFPKQRT